MEFKDEGINVIERIDQVNKKKFLSTLPNLNVTLKRINCFYFRNNHLKNSRNLKREEKK